MTKRNRYYSEAKTVFLKIGGFSVFA